MHFLFVKSVTGGFEHNLTSCVTVEISVSVFDITYDALVLVLTWVKTAGTRKAFSQLGVKAPLTTMLLRDGER